ncbi:MAG: hypothetical protein ACI93R_003503 [Flavobacteriales bacterium]
MVFFVKFIKSSLFIRWRCLSVLSVFAVVNSACVKDAVIVQESPPVYVQAKPAPLVSIAKRLLNKAEAALKKGRYFEPETDNAHMYYQALLVAEPNNSAAKSGMDVILIQSIAQARDAIKRGRFAVASKQLDRLESRFQQNVLVTDMRAQLDLQRQTKVTLAALLTQGVEEPDAIDENVILIEPQLLRSRDKHLIKQLGEFAQTLQFTKESVLIFARSDRDARWLYQTMREASPSYRIRGDIRIGEPKIQVLPPID